MKKRRLAREYAFQFLFHLQLPIFNEIKTQLMEHDNQTLLGTELSQFNSTQEEIPSGENLNFALNLIEGVLQHSHHLEEVITKYSTNWKPDRIPKVEYSLLLLSLYELLYHPQTASSIIINEAIELAKKFGSKDSKQFINGILDAVKKNERKE